MDTISSENKVCMTIKRAIRLWIEIQRARVNSGEIKQTSYSHKEVILRIHLIGYLESKGIYNINEINDITVIAKTDDNLIMGIKYKRHPVYGMQFHPEVTHTPHGVDLLRNFLYEICNINREEIRAA